MADPRTPPDDAIAPLAVLIGLDGSQRVWALGALPPPPELLVPRRPRMSVQIDEPPQRLLPHRVFRLQRYWESTNHRWWEVYNEGRSRTPRNGFVYLEVPTHG